MNLLDFFPGKKTYFTGIAMILYGVAGFLVPDQIQLDDPVQTIMLGIGMMTLRKGMAK